MLSNQVFRLGRNGLEPIETIPAVIGQKVLQAHYHEVGVICAAEMGGYTVIFPDGSTSHGQQFQSLSPFTRISPVAPLETVDADEVARLKALAVKYRQDQAEAAKIAATKKAKEVEELTAKLRAEYPKAKPGKASLNLKAELTRTFPGVKFSVRGDHNSINIKYTDGPALDSVESIANKYQDGHFDGMQDMHKYDNSAYGQAFDAVCGRVKYVFTERKYTTDATQSAADLIATRYASETPMIVKTSDYDGHAYIEFDYTREHQHRDIYALLRATDLRF